MSDGFRGGCLCGAVRYVIAAEPIMAGNCHCRDCQKLSGGGHVSMIAFPEGAITLTGNVTHFERKADSGATVRRRFCTVCGSPVLGSSSGMPGMAMVSAGTLDDPSAFSPQMSVYVSRAHGWDPPFAGAPSFPEMPPLGP